MILGPLAQNNIPSLILESLNTVSYS